MIGAWILRDFEGCTMFSKYDSQFMLSEVTSRPNNKLC